MSFGCLFPQNVEKKTMEIIPFDVWNVIVVWLVSWDWKCLSTNPNITFENVLDHPEKEWNWSWLSANPNITFEDVLNHPDKSWDWVRLTQNKFNKSVIGGGCVSKIN